MTIETPDPALERKRASLAKAREAKKQKAATKTAQSEDPEALRAEMARIQEKLADQRQPIPAGVAPGTVIKDGLGPDKIPWTPAVLRDYCNRGVTIDGVKFEWKSILGDGKILSVSWQGIVYWLWPERDNKIPSVHHTVYMQALEDRRREQDRWRSPETPRAGNLDGFNSAEAHSAEIGAPSNLGHVMGVGPLEPRGE